MKIEGFQDRTWAVAAVGIASAALLVGAPELVDAATLGTAKTKVISKLSTLFAYARNICIGLAAFSFLAFGVMLISGKFNPKWMWTSLAGVGVFGVAGYVANEFVTGADVQATMGGGTGIVLQ